MPTRAVAWLKNLLCCLLSGNMSGVLYEAWLGCEGKWRTSRLYISIKNRHSNKRTGVRRWQTRQQLEAKFGVEVTEDLINRKLGCQKLKETETRAHPELPHREDQVLVFHSS